MYNSRKEQILAVAKNLFREKGFAATSMRHIAAGVGIEPASLYNHLTSKDALLKEICFTLAGKFFEKINSAIIPDMPATDNLHAAINAHISVITDNLDASAVFFHDWRHLNPEAKAEFKSMRAQYEQIFRNIVRKGIADEDFQVMDEKFSVLTIFSAMNWTYEWYKPEGNIKPAEIAESISNIILQGIKTEKNLVIT